MTRSLFRFGLLEARRGKFADVLDDVRGVNLVVTSPPYNIGSKSPKQITARSRGGYDAKSWGAIEGYADKRPEATYQESQAAFLRWCEQRLAKGGVIVYNHKDRHVKGRLISPLEWILKVSDVLVIHDQIVWDRGSTHNHSPAFCYPENEYIFVLKRPREKIAFKNQDFFWKLNPNKGCSTVWRIPPHITRHNPHNAPFPLHLAQHCVRLWSKPGDLVCDPYLGSGTSLIAAGLEGRRFVGSEMLDNYFQLVQDRARETLRAGAVA